MLDNTSSLKEIKNDIVVKVINELSSMRYMSDTDKQLYIQQVISKVNNKQLVTTLRTQSDITNADDYNQTAFELYLDILTVFNYIDSLYQTLSSHQKLNESIMNTLHSTINSLNDKLDECETTLGIAGSPSCFIECFRTQNNQEFDKSYYTERYGEKMPIETHVMFNPYQENITLNYTRQQNVMVYKSGVQLGEISITKQYGAGFIKAKNSETKLENAIDTSPSSYWSETILSDNELEIVGDGFDTYNGKSNRSFYNLKKGAMCELCLTFEALAKINEIILRPFGNFPIDVIAIRYQLTDAEDDDIYDIVCPDNPNYSWLNTTSINSEYAFHFPEITCKKLYILINQLHCIKDSYLISSNQMFKNELWFNSTYSLDSSLKTDNTTVFKPNYIDRASEDNVWKYINNKMVTNKTLNINDMLINNKNKYIPVTKYQYSYGFYNIAPNFVEFQRASCYVSQEIEVNSAIDTIRLYSEEEHFKTRDGLIATDIEFYITAQKNPSYDDWKPICPYNKDYVYKELLQLDYDYCYLRHSAVCGNVITYTKNNEQRVEMVRPIVYMNDIILTEDVDYILRYDGDMNVIAIEISNIDHFALYTVSYQPTDFSKELSLIDDDNPLPSNSYEEIMGNGTACYELSNYSYYTITDSDLISSYLKIIDSDTNMVLNQTNQPSSPIKCVTNRNNPFESYRNFNQNSNIIQYYTNGKYLYFNRPISSNQKIEINYPSFANKIRVKAILRRNTKTDRWITPVLKQFRLEFTTI